MQKFPNFVLIFKHLLLINFKSSSLQIVNPPWTLKGEGFIFIYNLSATEQSELWDSETPTSGITVMMLVHYTESPIGPYDELLLIPGQIEVEGKKGYSISHIHVSTDISTENGIKHWGIPKETSGFSSKRKEQVHHSEITNSAGELSTIEAYSLGIKIPVFTHILPYSLLQANGNQMCTLRPTARGITKIAKLKRFESNQAGFNKLVGKTPLFGFHATSFLMEFPEGKWV